MDNQYFSLKNNFLTQTFNSFSWQGPADELKHDLEEIRSLLLKLGQPGWVVRQNERLFLAGAGKLEHAGTSSINPLGWIGALKPENLGDENFCQVYGTRYALYAGAMANGIASEELVIAMGKAGFFGSFGAGGLSPARIEQAIQRIQAALPDGPYAFNLLNSPNEPAIEQRTVDLYLKYSIYSPVFTQGF